MPASLTPRTLDIIQCEITKEMIAVIAMHARNVIPCTPAPMLTAGERGSTSSAAGSAGGQARLGSAERLPSPPTTPGAALSLVPPLDMFITNLVLRSRVQAGTLVCTIVYLQRLRNRLPKEARGMECTCHRIFLATLIVAGKYLNDASPKNKYWARYSTVFTVAEVNLMEKQLLFLLDFDLRIENSDLNEAALAFVASEPKPSGPLTPTTPPASATHHQQYPVHKLSHAPDVARIYPPNLGLNRHASTLDAATGAAAAAPEKVDTQSKASANLLRAIPTDEKLGPRPSPKKRAVSRGHHGNIPHPSPVYHCHAVSAQSAAATLATAVAPPSSSSSALTASSAHSACFLQPLEQSGLKYATSRFQQQRYDPLAAPGHLGSRGRPRASISIPSFRGASAGATAGRPQPSASSPTGCNAGGRPPKARHILRHQSTLPDFNRLDMTITGDHDWLRTPLSLCPDTRHASTSRSAHPDASAQPLPPLPPPPARLASGTHHLEYSPVNTLVYEQSPAVAPATVGPAEAAGGLSRQPSGYRSTLNAHAIPPQPAESQRLRESKPGKPLDGCEYDADRTLSYVPDGVAQHCGGARPPAAQPQEQREREPHAYHADLHYHKNGGSGAGWQLKTKFLHPLSTWFRSSRHQNNGHGITPPPALPVLAPGSLARGAADQLAGPCPPHACDA
ncbi:PHO85 cyclin-1 [Coemansia biformis]|uniref:PHO85 cyclin-1 n=1 Tax=Coemansia biformis TaxID=1286918 RepID=A0A9W7YFG9_9FUNG|nr:PHO85 cyclin-1 [Coemansia biformis]